MGPVYSPFYMDVKLDVLPWGRTQRMLGNLVLRKILVLGSETEEVTGGWRKLHNRSFKFVIFF
jgi:hypothetical protein